MTRPAPAEPLIGIEVLAERLDISVQSIYEWRKHGRGPRGYRIGRRIKFRWSECEAWLQEQRESERGCAR